ncbi:MAG: single-stranded DNA-binding protein [Patescibacteria group bacterium]|nr:single-stranded DNA-binding protein [Patescibacteria group bacterium]
MDLNKAQIIGNLTRDPEVRSTTSGQSVASFGVATNRVWKDKASGERKSSAEFHNIVAWGRLAEICQQYLKKGSKVYFEGRLQTRSWEDPSGVKKYRTEIVAQNMIMLDKKGEGPSGAGANQGQNQKNKPEEEEINVDDIPF